jgi:putative endonuclease
MYFVYILQSQKTGEYYKGITKDLGRRLSEHNSGKNKSTKSKMPWTLVYSEECYDRIEARVREKYFKSGFGRELLKNM